MQHDSNINIVKQGLWFNNIALVQVLGLCPLLAVTATAINGLTLGLATTLTLMISNIIISLVRPFIRQDIRLPIFVLVIACTVTTIELIMNAWFFELYLILGIFIPLIVTNCAIIGRAEAFASKQPVLPAFVDGLSMGIGFTLVLTLLGTLRELIGYGTVFTQAELLFGIEAKWLTITVFSDYKGFLMAALPPGAFLALGFLIALKNSIDGRQQTKQSSVPHKIRVAKGGDLV